MTKLAYERPVMRAEAFATNAYCNACGGPASFLEGALSLASSMISGWFKLGFGGSKGASMTPDKAWEGLSFEQSSRQDMTSLAGNTYGQKQYYWVTEANDTRYYLEYSVGNTDSWKSGDVFVLYSERTGDTKLDVNFWTYGGTDADDNDINWPFVGYSYDNSLAAIQFNDRVVQDS